MTGITGRQSSGVFGAHLVDSITLPERTQNLLFGALIGTAIGVFIGGNLLLADPSVLWRSAQMALPGFMLLLIFYAISRQSGSLIWGLALTYALMLAFVYGRLSWSVPLMYGIALAALLYALRFLRIERRDWLMLLLMSLIATATILGVERAYTSFDMLSRLNAGDIHQDTLFHASLAAMIKNYGVSSTGLHGLVEVPYHTLSHVLMAGISLLSGIGVLEIYGVASWVLFAPLLIFSVVAFCGMLDRQEQLPIPIVWGLTSVLLALLPFLLGRWAVGDSFFVSESYLVSLGLFMLGLGLLFKLRLTVLDLLLVFLLAVLISNAKASVGLIFVGLWFSRVLFVRGERWAPDLAAFVLAGLAVGWVVLDSAQSNADAMSISPLSFVRSYSFLGGHLGDAAKAMLAGAQVQFRTLVLAALALTGFFILHFVLSWIVILQISYHSGLSRVLSAPLGVYALASAFAGIVLVSLVAIPGGSAYYFSNVAFFVALPGVVVLLALEILRRGLSQRVVMILSLFLICLFSLRAYYNASGLHPRHAVRADSPLIYALNAVRRDSPKNLVLRPEVNAMAHNPIARCTAQPFVFPAVSERPWVGVIKAQKDCHFINYGYAQYGITDTQSEIRVSPRLSKGMLIQPNAWECPACAPAIQ